MTAKKDAPAFEGHWQNGRWHTHLGLDTPGPTPYAARLTVRECCQARGLSVYQVAWSGLATGTVDPGTVYRLARGDTSRIDLPTLETLAGIIHTLSGQPVSVSDLLSLTPTGPRVDCWTSGDIRRWKARKKP